MPKGTPKGTPKDKVKIILKKVPSLSMFGYSLKEKDASVRRDALIPAINLWGGVYVIRKLNVLYIYRKNKYVTQGKRARADMKFVQKYLKSHRNTKSKTLSPNVLSNYLKKEI